MLKERIKLILKSVREYKVYALCTPLFMAGEAAVECCLPFVMSLLLEQVKLASASGNNSLKFIIPWILLLMLMAIASIVFGILGGRFASIASNGFAKNLRNDLYEKINSFSFSNIDKFSTSSLVTRLTTDITYVQQSFQMCTRVVIRSPLMLIFSALMAFITGGTMAFVFIAIIPIIIFGLGLIMAKAIKIFTRVFKRYDALNQSVQENVSGIRVVKSYVREDFENEKFKKASNSITQEFIHAEKIVAFNNPLMNTCVHLGNICLLAIGSNIILNSGAVPYEYTNEKGEIYVKMIDSWFSTEKLSALQTYGVQILMSLMMISMILVMLIMSLESVNRIGEVLEEEPTIAEPENPVLNVKDGSVEFKKVNFKYKKDAEKYTLKNLSFKIKSGEFVGILGSTGSGKTSAINLISRLYDATEGEVLVGGINVKNYQLKTLRDNVAVVLQKNFLFSGTIADNLRWGDQNATQEDLENACKISQAHEFIEKYPEKYLRPIEQGGANVSGGQKQRLCIARAVLAKPKILILDDSTSAVDTRTDALIRKALKEKIPETTKIVIAQRISSIEDADQIIIMDNGEINAIGTHEELLASNKIYQEVYYTQNKKGGTN